MTTDHVYPEANRDDPARARPRSAIARAADQVLRGDGNDHAVRIAENRDKTRTALLAIRLDTSYRSGNSTLNYRNRTSGQDRL